MQKIRTQARQLAWYTQPDDKVKTYNFFGRFNPHAKSRYDEENLPLPALTQISSASPIEDRRRPNGGDFGTASHPPKSKTFGDAPSTEHLQSGSDKTDGSSIGRTEISTNEKSALDHTGEQPQRSLPPPLETNTGLTGSTAKENGEVQPGPRKRKHRKFHNPFGKKKDAADGRTATNGSTDHKGDNHADKSKHKITLASQFKAVFYSWINILLVFVPVGIALNYSGVNKIVVFCINFVAIIPLAAMLSYATEELALYIGEVLGGLLNATFGNAVELIVSIIALTQHKVLIVQTSLIGSMLSNLLLVMGMCFFFGGLRRQEQFFNITVAQTAASLLTLAIGSLIIPTAFQIFSTDQSASNGVTPLSRGTSVLLLLVYACYLIFQLRTHIGMYNQAGGKATTKESIRKEGEAKEAGAMARATGAAVVGGQINQENLERSSEEKEEEEEAQQPSLTKIGALITLAGSTVFIALCAEYMVTAINVVGEHISQEFIGLILLPIVGNAAEHATAVTVAIKDKMDLAIGVAVGSSLQIALLVLPLMVMLNWWGLGSPSDMNLSFDGFLVSVLFISIILVNYLIQDGKSHWLEGVMLQVAYLIIAVAAYFYPAKGDVAG